MKNLEISNDLTGRHKVILHVIPYGALNAVSMKYVSRLLGVDRRTVRLMIQNARIDGNIIAGTDAGFFVPETINELREYVHRTRSRINTSSLTLKPAVQLLEGLENGN